MPDASPSTSPARPIWRGAGFALAIALAAAALVSPLSTAAPEYRQEYGVWRQVKPHSGQNVIGLMWEESGNETRGYGFFGFPGGNQIFLFWMVSAVVLFWTGLLCLVARRRGGTVLGGALALAIGCLALVIFGGLSPALLLWTTGNGVLITLGALTGTVVPTAQPYIPKPSKPRFTSTRNPFADGAADAADGPEEGTAREDEETAVEPTIFSSGRPARPLVTAPTPDSWPNRRRVRIAGLITALGLYVTSFFLPLSRTHEGIAAEQLLHGILGAVLFFPPLLLIGLANPAFFVGLHCLTRGDGRRAVRWGVASLVLGSGGLIAGLPDLPGSAYFVWVGSMAVLVVVSYFGGIHPLYRPLRLRPGDAPNPFADSPGENSPADEA